MKLLFTVRALLRPMLLAFLGAAMTAACGSVGPGDDPPDPVDESSLAIKGTFPPDKRASLGASPPVPQDPIECRDLIKEESCKKYRIQLQGSPSMNPTLQAKYKAWFGSACYVSAANTFDCFYKDPLKACEDGVLVPDIYGAAEYDKTYKCQQVPGTVGRSPVFAHARDPELALSGLKQRGPPRARAKIRSSPSNSRKDSALLLLRGRGVWGAEQSARLMGL